MTSVSDVGPNENIAYVGLGSNLDDPVIQIFRALQELNQCPDIRLIKRSALYRNPPMGPLAQPNYVNAVAAIETQLSPLELLSELQRIELNHHRKREIRWGPRTLDLDLLLFGEMVIDDPLLRVPHPGLHERAFVLYPLSEIAPSLFIPGRGRLQGLIARCPFDGLERIDEH